MKPQIQPQLKSLNFMKFAKLSIATQKTMNLAIIRLFILSLVFLTSSCFEILQLIETKKDGTVKMSLRISVSKALQDEGKPAKQAFVNDLIADTHRIYKNVQVLDLSDDLTSREQFNFATTRKLLSTVSEKDEGGFLPYPDGNHQWVFLFQRSNTKGLANNSEGGSDLSEEGSEQFAAMFLSSAQYRIFFRGYGLPKQVVFTSIDGKKYNLKVTSFGDGVLIDCPIMIIFKGGVITTTTQSKIDFNRTNRLIDFLREQRDSNTTDKPNKDQNQIEDENLNYENPNNQDLNNEDQNSDGNDSANDKGIN